MSSATPTELLLRPALPDDGPLIAALYTATRAAAVPHMPPAMHTAEEDVTHFSALIVDGEHETWVAEQDGRVLGFAILTATWLDGLYVRPDAQGRGVGTALLQLAQALRPDGFGLWVFESNTPARALYERHGFVETERTDGSGNEEKAPDIRMNWPADR
ncbi:GNAT family N-acetyltransferase [Nocardioides sp. CER19]|uniref:GNAT family N-acetyltransferase n=1 Tax=Nocardioides sp. CER19 TaxID=3038538 RepID=UPI00244C1521|nr:GNAT family N-acetyltransferase [Nocardioides sp. CER19]MDH2416689.1 GNAT family N-acetyltransferase [Nocardioides sp. CER19]